MIKTSHLSHDFDYPLFSDVSFEVKPKEKVSILGVSGSGKSTLLHMLSTFLKPQKGEVFLFDKNIYTLSKKELLEIRRFHIGIIFQFHYLFNGFLAKENIEAATLLADTPLDKTLLKRLEIEEVMNQNIQTLSGGQQQRVSIARVLAKKPKIIFADEPTGNLDRKTAFLVIDMLECYCEENEASLVMVTHDQEIAERTDTKYELKDKKLWRL